MGKIIVTMLAGFAEFERNVISERTATALSFKKRSGQVTITFRLGTWPKMAHSFLIQQSRR